MRRGQKVKKEVMRMCQLREPETGARARSGEGGENEDGSGNGAEADGDAISELDEPLVGGVEDADIGE